MRTTLPVHPIDLEPFRSGGPRRAPGGRASGSTPRAGTPASCVVTGHGVPTGHVRRACSTRSARSSTAPSTRSVAVVVADRVGEPRLQRARQGRARVQPGRGDAARPVRGVQRRAARTPSGDVLRRAPIFYAPNVWPDRARRTCATRGARTSARITRGRRHAPAGDGARRSTCPSSGSSTGCEHAIITTRAHQLRAPRRRARSASGSDAHGCAHRLRHPHHPARRRRPRPPGVPRRRVARRGGAARVRSSATSATCSHAGPTTAGRRPCTGSCRRPRRAPAPVRRRSIARFLDCPPDLVVECIPTCVDGRASRRATSRSSRVRGCAQKILGGRAPPTDPTSDEAAVSGVVTIARSSLARSGVSRRRRDELDAFFAEHGFAVLRGLYTEAELDELQTRARSLQRGCSSGELPEPVRHRHPRRSRRGDRRRAVRALRVRSHRGVGDRARRGDAPGDRRRGAAPAR